MLERFHVPDDIAVRVPEGDMRKTVEEIFRKLGMSEEDAFQSADVLLYADIRGVESHGVSNVMERYVELLQTGQMNPDPNWRISRETPAICTIDGDRGHGLVVGAVGMREAIERAAKYGIGSVSVTNSGHLGAVGYFAMMALEHDMIGIAMTTGGVKVVPTHGSQPLVGLNPIAIAAPTQKEPPFVFDACMSSIAGSKLPMATRLGVDPLPGWVAGSDGSPIMDERPLPDGFMMLPLGATREIGSHKGYSLAVMIEIVSGVLSGNGAGPFRRGDYGHHFLAYKIEAFSDVGDFKKDLDAYMKVLRESSVAPGDERVVYAGLLEHEEEAQRRLHGIPYHPEVIEWFRNITAELELPNRFG